MHHAPLFPLPAPPSTPRKVSLSPRASVHGVDDAPPQHATALSNTSPTNPYTRYTTNSHLLYHLFRFPCPCLPPVLPTPSSARGLTGLRTPNAESSSTLPPNEHDNTEQNIVPPHRPPFVGMQQGGLRYNPGEAGITGRHAVRHSRI